MGEITAISWTDHTWNPWHGCTKISPGCKFCYMYRDKERYGQDPAVTVRSKTTFNAPFQWESGRVFTCSWSDFFIEDADPWRDEAWEVIRRTPHLTYQILTKRPERILAHLPFDWGHGWHNVWLGVSVENQEYADERIPKLLEVPAHVRFLSIEPLLGPVNIALWLGTDTDPSDNDREYPGVEWVIGGGESGPKARPCDLRWLDSLRLQCKAAEVAFFCKQLGQKPHTGRIEIHVTNAGTDPNEWPEFMRVQEFPVG